MIRLPAKLVRTVTILIVVFTQLMGCISLKDVSEARRLPGPSNMYFTHQDIFYDPDIRGYSLKKVSDGSESGINGVALRDAFGKKIKTEEELVRVLAKKENGQLAKEGKGVGAKMAYMIGLVVYLPVVIVVGAVEGVVNGVLNIPFSPIPAHLEATYQKGAEASYARGRDRFDAGKFDEALTEWEHARFLMPSLQGNSDIDYWRGRAFEARHESKLAITAYQEFLDYSERATPFYFHYSYPEDPEWSKKAEDVEKRASALINTISLSMQKSQGHLGNE